MNLIDKDAVVATIKKHIREEPHSYFCKCLLSEIDTLKVKEQPSLPSNLDEAARLSAVSVPPIWPEKNIESHIRGFKAGAEWQKEQMLKDASVESLIVEDGRIELEGDQLPCLNPIILLPYPQFKPGDKVRIIIIKED